MEKKDIYTMVEQLATARENCEKIEKQRNLLISCGLKHAADKLNGEIAQARAKRDEILATCREMEDENRKNIFLMFFALDCGYNRAIIWQEYWNKFTKTHEELAKEIKDVRDSLQTTIAGIDEYGIAKMSDIYAEATTELDELYEQHVQPLLESIYNKYAERLKRAYEGQKHKK